MEEWQIFLIIFIVIVFIVFKLFYLKNKTKIQEKVQNITEEDVKNIVKEGIEKGTIEEGEEEMIHSIF